jgi:hypothetical protein
MGSSVDLSVWTSIISPRELGRNRTAFLEPAQDSVMLAHGPCGQDMPPHATIQAIACRTADRRACSAGRKLERRGHV